MLTVLNSLVSVPVEVTYDSPSLFVGMKVFQWVIDAWIQVGGVVPVYNVGGGSPTYGAIFVPQQIGQQYIVELAAYEDSSLSSYNSAYYPSSHSIMVDPTVVNQINSLILGNNNPVLTVDQSPVVVHGSSKPHHHEELCEDQNGLYGPLWGSQDEATAGQACKQVQRTITRGSDTYIDFTIILDKRTFLDLTSASEIAVVMLNADGTFLTLKYSAGDIALIIANQGKFRAFLNVDQTLALALGINGVKVKVVINGKTAVINAPNILQVNDELFPGA